MANKTELKMEIIRSKLADAGLFDGGGQNINLLPGNDVAITSSFPAANPSPDADNLIVDFTGQNRTLSGFGGDDVLVGGVGADTLLGGTSFDTAAYVNAASAITLNLGFSATEANALLNGGDARGDVLSSIEAVVGSQFGDRIEGTGGTERLFGWKGNDSLVGGQGIDKLRGATVTTSSSPSSASPLTPSPRRSERN
jgi:Ca2+-binding RTX toxin-like protein